MNKKILVFFTLSFLLILGISTIFAIDCWQYDDDQTNCQSFDDCTWMSDPWGSWCDQKGCWNLWTQANCQNSSNIINMSCQWQSGVSNWCEQIDCYYFEGTNQTACEITANTTYGLICEWDERCMSTGHGAGEECWTITNETTCRNTAGCVWGGCYKQGCPTWSTQSDCIQHTGFNGRTCKWNSGENYCYEQGCFDYKTSSTCTANNCTWSGSSCKDPWCSDWDNINASACVNNTAGLSCSWDGTYCNYGGCGIYTTQDTCEAVNLTGTTCIWDTDHPSWCEKVECWQFDNTNQTMCETTATQLYNLTCVWNNNTGQEWCYQNITTSLSCGSFTNEKDCMDTMVCSWNPANDTCTDFGGDMIFNEWNPGCYIFDINQTHCENVIGCYWSNNLCETNTTIIPSSQLNCTLINDSSMCNSIPALSTCCKWQGSSCAKDWSDTSCRDQMETPPTGAMYCEDYKAYSSQTLCEQIAGSPWFMPCQWDNTTKHCEFKSDKIFGGGAVGKGGFSSIDNQINCESAGGRWVTDTYCEVDPGNSSNYIAIPSFKCDPGFNQKVNCDKSCFACENKKDGSAWGSTAEARQACENSKAGVPPELRDDPNAVGWCEFVANTEAPNGYGFCKQKGDLKNMGGFDCNSDCGACTFMGKISEGKPQKACLASAANCKWVDDPSDANNGWCAAASEKSCADKCDRCYDQSSCMDTGQGGSGACTWDDAALMCKPSSGAGDMEICFDGIDNDGNNKIDCADSKCMTDPFCGGAFMFNDFGVDCFAFTDDSSCDGAGCTWINEQWGSFCDMPGASCWKQDGTDKTTCEAVGGGGVCEWHTGGGGFCDIPESNASTCFGKNSTTCNSTSSCVWVTDSYCDDQGGICDPNPDYASPGYDCAQYDSAGQAICNTTGTPDDEGDYPCKWYVDSWCQGMGGDAGHCDFIAFSCFQYDDDTTCTAGNNSNYCRWNSDPYSPAGGWCDAKCFNPNLNKIQCGNTSLVSGVNCTWLSGFCDPKGFGGEMGKGGMGSNCMMYDGNKTGCNNQTGCTYFAESSEAQFCDVDFSNNCPQYSYNETLCNEKPLCKYNTQENFCDEKPFECFWNSTLKDNFTLCDEHPLCYVNYQWKAQGDCEPVCFNLTSGNCNVAGCKAMTGWCDPAMGAEMFQHMEKGEPTMLGMDACPEGISNESDICGFGMKGMMSGWGFGIGVQSISNAAICNGVKTGWGSTGTGTNATKFFWYLDTDGSTSGNCAPKDNSTLTGFEFYFKYEGSYDTSTGQASETYSAYKCVEGEWGVADIKLSSKKKFMCSDIRGALIAVEKDDLNKFPTLFVPGSDFRVYVATADGNANVTNPTDTAGPGYGTPDAIDFKPECCWDPGADCDNDGWQSSEDQDCIDLFRSGYVVYEDCFTTNDDDGDGLAGCNDPDCVCEESDCSDLPHCANTGVNAAGYQDTTAPRIKSIRIEGYNDSALILYDTDEPANGTLTFYHTSDTCKEDVPGKTDVYDSGILYSNVKQYKVWHDAELYNATNESGLIETLNGMNVSLDSPLVSPTGLYYKLTVCDKSGNCAKSACLGFNISLTDCAYCDFVSKIGVPTGWTVSYDVNTNGTYDHVQGQVCGANAGMKTNHITGRRVNILVNKSDGSTWIKFSDARLTRSGMNWAVQDINETGISTGSSGGYTYTGLPKRTRDKIINNLHPKKCQIKIPGTSNQLWHCSEDLSTCVQIPNAATNYLNESGSDYRIWDIPYCEFSVWTGGDLSYSPPSDDGGDGATTGAVTGGGGVAETTTTTTPAAATTVVETTVPTPTTKPKVTTTVKPEVEELGIFSIPMIIAVIIGVFVVVLIVLLIARSKASHQNRYKSSWSSKI